MFGIVLTTIASGILILDNLNTKKYQNRIFIKLFFVNVLLVLFTLILGFSSKTYNYYIELTTFVTTIIVFVILSVTGLIKKGYKWTFWFFHFYFQFQ